MIENLERIQESRTQSQTSSNRTSASGYAGPPLRVPSSQISPSQKSAGDSVVSIILVVLMMIGYGLVSPINHSGSSPLLGAFVSGFFMAIFATGIYIRFHRNPRTVPVGMIFVLLFLVYFFLTFL